MEVTSRRFRQASRRAIANPDLQSAMQRIKVGFSASRNAAAARLPEFEQLRGEARDIRDHTLDPLDYYLARFEERVIENGGQVHWCESAGEVNAKVLELCQAAGAKLVTKGKSMITEETGLNPYLERHGVEPQETDLGEYIIQLAEEPPSHLLGPAAHKTVDQVKALFNEFHAAHRAETGTQAPEEPRDMVGEARHVLREKYFAADVGITGGNFLVAETGSVIIVTNEGNGDLTQTLTPMHIVVSSIEKVVPTLEDAETLLRLLARSATGQETAVYTTYANGPRRDGDLDGPKAFHVVLLDNGRSDMLGGEFRDMLRCIRCSACMNACPVYGTVGGHAYGSVYMGPMGAVLTPHFAGIAQARDLPAASTFCGACEAVCPVHIPLPSLMRRWRRRAMATGAVGARERVGLKVWGWLARRPAAYRFFCGLMVRLLGRLGWRGRFGWLPFAGAWTQGRHLPAPEGRTFIEMWKLRS